MPPPIPVTLSPSDPSWPDLAEVLAVRLRVLGPTLLAVHHIGSTSVPGLAAKPIIDLIPEVTDLERLDHKRRLVEEAGYAWHGELGLAGRRYCTLSDESGRRLAQLHFFQTGSPQITRHMAFRDYLRAHPAVAGEYECEKRKARALFPDNSHAYSDAKSAWIKGTEERALEWVAQR